MKEWLTFFIAEAFIALIDTDNPLIVSTGFRQDKRITTHESRDIVGIPPARFIYLQVFCITKPEHGNRNNIPARLCKDYRLFLDSLTELDTS